MISVALMETQTSGSCDEVEGPGGFLGDLGSERKRTAGSQSGSVTKMLDEVDSGFPGIAGTAVRLPEMERDRRGPDRGQDRAADAVIGDMEDVSPGIDDAVVGGSGYQVGTGQVGNVRGLGSESDVVGGAGLGEGPVLDHVDFVG